MPFQSKDASGFSCDTRINNPLTGSVLWCRPAPPPPQHLDSLLQATRSASDARIVHLWSTNPIKNGKLIYLILICRFCSLHVLGNKICDQKLDLSSLKSNLSLVVFSATPQENVVKWYQMSMQAVSTIPSSFTARQTVLDATAGSSTSWWPVCRCTDARPQYAVVAGGDYKSN